MKILVTGLRGIPSIMGGIESHAEALYPRLKRLRPADRIVIFGRSPYLKARADEHQGVEVRSVFAVRNKYLETILHTLLSILVARARFGGDVFHIHGVGPGVLAPLARALGYKVVLTHHGADYERAKWNRFAKGVLRWGERTAILSARQVIVVSDSMTATLRARYPHAAERIHYIPNGATLPPPSMAASDDDLYARLGVRRGRYVLGVARLVPEKALHDLVAAFERLPPSDLKLLIAGGADHKDAYATGLLAKASDRVIFAGLQPRAAVEQLYRGAALFAMPSYHEGLPIAALEAAAAGTPMLLSDIQPNRDLGLPATNYFRVGDVGALAERLNADPAQFGYDRQSLLARFDWDDVAARTRRIYDMMA